MKFVALSLSLMAFNVFSTAGALASDFPLAIKKIGLSPDNQVVILFTSRDGVFPNAPKVLEMKGPNHRIVMDFQNTSLDRVNMPTPEELSRKMHNLFPGINGVRFLSVANGSHPLARVIIDVPEELNVDPKVVNLDENSVTLSLGDDVTQAASELPELRNWTDPPGVSKAKPKPKTAAKTGKSAALLVAPGTFTIAQGLVAQAPAAANSPNSGWDWTAGMNSGGSSNTAATQSDLNPGNMPVAGTNPSAVIGTPSVTSEQPNAVAPGDGGLNLRPSHGTMEVQESTQSFAEPATMLQPGAQQVVTPGAAAMMKKPEEEEVKPKTVAELDNGDFRKVMTPDATPKQNVADASDQPLQLKPPLPTEDASATSMDAPPAKAVETTPAPSETKVMEAAPAAAPAAVSEKVAPVETESAASAQSNSALEVAPPQTSASEKIVEPAAASPSSAPSSEDMSTAADEAAAKSDVAATSSSSSKTEAALKLYNLAVKAHLSGKLQEAITDYKGALAANPSLSEAHSNLGLIYNQQHNYGQAIAEFRKALAINPKDAITYNGIGAAMRAEKDLPGAIKQWQTAVTLDPRLATAHYNLGTAYEIQKEYEKALESYKAAVKNDYRLGEAYYRMGIILVRSKRSDEAAEQFKAALKISKDSEYSEDARKRLALIESGGAGAAAAGKVK